MFHLEFTTIFREEKYHNKKVFIFINYKGTTIKSFHMYKLKRDHHKKVSTCTKYRGTTIKKYLCVSKIISLK